MVQLAAHALTVGLEGAGAVAVAASMQPLQRLCSVLVVSPCLAAPWRVPVVAIVQRCAARLHSTVLVRTNK